MKAEGAALVTGAGRGLGRAIALELARRGFAVHAGMRDLRQGESLLAEARAELDRALKVGGPGRFTDQVVGNFRLGVLIGRGGMGEVYEASSVADRGEAAVKLLHPGTLSDPTHVARFIREAETAAKLDCLNVVRVLEVVVEPLDQVHDHVWPLLFDRGEQSLERIADVDRDDIVAAFFDRLFDQIDLFGDRVPRFDDPSRIPIGGSSVIASPEIDDIVLDLVPENQYSCPLHAMRL